MKFKYTAFAHSAEGSADDLSFVFAVLLLLDVLLLLLLICLLLSNVGLNVNSFSAAALWTRRRYELDRMSRMERRAP